MRSFFGRYSKYAFGLSVLVVVLSLILWIGEVGVRRTGVVEAKITQETIFFDKANPHIRAVMAVQNRHTPDLMALPEVVGTATGLTEAGRLAIVILTKDGVEPSVIPGRLEEVPVVVKVTGEFFAMRPPAGKGKKKEVAPTARFDRPVPIGVSTGHPNITAGTIGCRVTDGENVYALSNNHVYADENNAFIGDNVLQPGTFDGGAEGYEDQVIDGDEIGTLYDYEPINFDGSDNTIDAAIALSSPDLLGNATPSDGYGKPKSAIVEASIGQKVMKYGRTTGLTK